MGAETHAAQAMRHGFDDFTVQDPALDYLLTLPAQIEAVLERTSSARARLRGRGHAGAPAPAAAGHLAGPGHVHCQLRAPGRRSRRLLGELMTLTQSAFGLVGQVQLRR